MFVNDESKYHRGNNPPICAMPRQEMNERSYRKIAEEVRKKKHLKLSFDKTKKGQKRTANGDLHSG